MKCKRLELLEKIEHLKRKRNALILAHNYQRPEVQDVADFVGDSLQLAVRAAAAKETVIVLCGVDFMAETAAILAPDKLVLHPVPSATCPMAAMVTPDDIRKLRRCHPGLTVVCYVNTTAAVKAEADLSCTSSNAVQVLATLNDPVAFLPDLNLAEHMEERLNRSLIKWRGFCIVHVSIKASHIRRLKNLHPDAVVVAHPECPRPVRHLADAVLSTGGMVKFAKDTNSEKIIVATEVGLLYRLRKQNPDKTFIAASKEAVCLNMKKIRLEDLFVSLENLSSRVVVEPTVAERARKALANLLGSMPCRG